LVKYGTQGATGRTRGKNQNGGTFAENMGEKTRGSGEDLPPEAGFGHEGRNFHSIEETAKHLRTRGEFAGGPADFDPESKKNWGRQKKTQRKKN